MNTKKLSILFAVAATASASAQLASLGGGILLGGGYLDDPEKGYAFGQIRGTFYEDDRVAHTVFLEILGHGDDATLIFDDGFGGTFAEDGDITFLNVTANYEIELKLAGPLSVYAGGGAGIEFVTVDDRFDLQVDSDTNFSAQVFAGLRANFQNGFHLQAGVRYLFREDFSLLGDQFVTNDSWGYEIGGGFKF